MKTLTAVLLAIISAIWLISGCGGGGGDNGVESASAYEQLGATINRLQFYEAGAESVPLDQRDYGNFQQQTTRYVFFEIHLEYPQPGRVVAFSLRADYHRADGSIFSQVTAAFTVQPEWKKSIHIWGSGWDAPGNWPAGEYTVKIYDAQRQGIIATGQFVIGDGGDPDLTVPGIVDYYPSSGPVGSHILLLLAEPVTASLAPQLTAFYNDREISVTGVSDKIVQAVLPYDAVSGNLELRAGRSASNRVYFTVADMVVTPAATEQISPSSTWQTIRYQDQIGVTIPPGLLDKTRMLRISTVDHAPVKFVNPLGRSLTFDVSIDGLEQLNDYLEIDMKVDLEGLNPLYPAEDQLMALRWDEAGKFWIALPYRLDPDQQRLYVYTDHLSLIGWTILTGVATAVSWVGEKALNDVYTTPLGNIRILYSKKAMDADSYFASPFWERFGGPDMFTISYDPRYPRYIQDMGHLFEIALNHFRTAGFKDPIVKPGLLWGESRNPTTVKIDSWWSKTVGLGGSDPQYEKIWQNIHLPADALKDYRDHHSSYAIIGHELFHRFQAEYYGRSGFMRSGNFWWIEATAEYAGSRAAWGDRKLKAFQENIGADFLSYPLNKTGVTWGDKAHEYATSVFIQFLTEVKSLNFKDLVEYVAGGDPFLRLNAYISSKDHLYLKDYYAQFAAWAIFANNSFLNPYKIVNEIAERDDVMQLAADDALKFEVKGGNAVFVDIFQLPNDGKVPGDAFPAPLATLKSGDEFELAAIKNKQVIYLLGVNNGEQDNSLTVTVKVAEEDGIEKTHTFNLKGHYSAKLWAIMIDKAGLTITPDEIPNGKAGEKYTFALSADNIPELVRQVYFVWDFGDSGTWSKGESKSVDVVSGKAQLDISYTYPSGKSECLLAVAVKDLATGKELAHAQARISFVAVSIQGPRTVIYEMVDGAVEVRHQFEAVAAPVGEYRFHWDFGDGNTASETKNPGQSSSVSHTYQGLKNGDEFRPAVKLFNRAGELAAQDAVVIKIQSAPSGCGWVVDYSQLTRDLNNSTDNYGYYHVNAAGQLHGAEEFWWDSAWTQPRGKGCWYEDEKHGWWTMWWTDGHKSSEGNYDHGKSVGLWKHWDILDKSCSICDYGDDSTGMAPCNPCP